MDTKILLGRPAHELCTAQVIGTFGGGGAQRLAYNLAVGLAQQGVRSLAIALRAEGNYGDAAGREIKLVAFRADVRKPLSLLRAFFGFRSFIYRERIDLLHVHGAPSLPFVVFATRILR